MKRKIISLMLTIILLSSTMTTVFAVTSSSEYKNQANQAANQKNEAKEDLQEVNVKINSALQEVQDLTNQIEEVEKEVSSLGNQVEDLKKSISEKEEDLKDKKRILEERLVISYMNGENTYLDALLSGGIVSFISNYETIKQIVEYDNNLIKEVDNVKKALESEKVQVENVKIAKEAKSNELKKLKNNKQEKVNKLTEEQKAIQQKIDEYDAQEKEFDRLEKLALEREKKEAEEARRKAAEAAANGNKDKGQSSNTGTGNKGQSSGSFTWPVPSSHRITSPYGYRIHPISGTKKFHSGIDIGASGGSPIVAADGGKVILASNGWNGGYGNYIIISHANGYTTRYAHCQALYVKEGQEVKKGETIAGVGTTGSSTGNHLHFEIRLNGETQNPSNYV